MSCKSTFTSFNVMKAKVQLVRRLGKKQLINKRDVLFNACLNKSFIQTGFHDSHRVSVYFSNEAYE